ncbi:MAG: PAS domain S-box protein [Proteobacteria bacterium]|nr:PAS domain S-box protein [Pseudomonadota bacterium]
MERTEEMGSWYHRFRSFAMNRMSSSSVMEEDSLMYWRVRILFSILFAVSVFGLITLVPVFILVIKNNLWGLGIFDLAAWFIITMLLLVRNIRFETRSAITLGLTYILGLVIIVNVGILSGGPLCLFAFAVFAGIFRGTRAVSLALALNAITLVIISWLVSTGRFGQAFPFFKTSEAMMASLATFMLLNIAVAVSVRLLVKGLSKTNQQQKELLRDLEIEKSQLENTKIMLNLEVEKHKRTEESVMRERDLTQATIESLPGLFYLFDEHGKFLRWNKNLEEISGYSFQEISCMSPLDFFGEPDKETIAEAIQKVFLTGQASVEADFLSKNQTRTPCLFTGKSFLFDKKPCLIGMGIDITNRKQAEKALLESEKKYRSILENIEDGYYEVDTAGNFTFFNDSMCRIIGYSADELMGRNNREYMDDNNAKKIFKVFNEVYKTGIPTKAFDWELIRKDGSICFVETVVSLITDSNNVKIGFGGIARDITERKHAEKALLESEKKYRNILENIEDGYYEVNIAGNFTFFNNSTCRILGYSADDLMDKNNREYVDDENAKKIFKVYNEVYRTGIHVKAFDWELIRKDGSKCFVETDVSLILDSNNVKTGFCGIARDVTERKRAEKELDNSFKQLRAALGGTIQALAVAVETRDPYTAGHQKRVADLSRAIAKEMCLDNNLTDGIRMAGVIHDLGKMSIPAEILSKPTKLSAIEYSLIKTHPQAGYDILKDVEFPWPIAQIVLQHHERIDGSGYPAGLKGEEILMEARIIAVADVVEAIASYRPYRQALGIEKALGEITQYSGILYDPAVVDACLRLFNEKGYKLQ